MNRQSQPNTPIFFKFTNTSILTVRSTVRAVIAWFFFSSNSFGMPQFHTGDQTPGADGRWSGGEVIR